MKAIFSGFSKKLSRSRESSTSQGTPISRLAACKTPFRRMAFPGLQFVRFTEKSLGCIRMPTGMVKTDFPKDGKGEAHE
jgi:hypothetical protein